MAHQNVSVFSADQDFVASASRALEVLPRDKQSVSEFWRAKYEKEHVKNWDRFYRNNKANFFKDRHYLVREFGLDIPFGKPTVVFVELGCGVGNALIPLVSEFPTLQGIGIDCSQVAIDLLNARVSENTEIQGRCRGLVLDMTREDFTENEHIKSLLGTVDYLSMIFSLSACHPNTYQTVISNIRKLLRPNTGTVLFRDYAKYDLAQLRFSEKQALIDEDFYVRGDGTKAKFFSEDEISRLFSDFETCQLVTHTKKFVNRKTEVHMHRLWLQGVWKFHL